MVELISRRRHDWTIITSHIETEKTFPEFSYFKIVLIGDVSVRRNMGAVLKAALTICTTRIPLENFDAYVVWCDGLGTLTTFRNNRVPTFCICSTPLRPVYDPVYAKEALRSRKPLAKLVYRVFKKSFRAVDRLAWSRFTGVVATSLEVKERIVDNALFADDHRMILRYPGIAIADAPEKVSYEPFFLVPGRISWTKNIALAIDAFLKADLPAPWRLVVAGFVDEKSERTLAELRKRAAGNQRIEFVRNPDDRQLNHLYETAYSVLFTPLNEDWGIVPLESMLRSKPVVANRSGGPKESVADQVTGWLLDPVVDQWGELLQTLPEESVRVQQMGKNGRARVERYDWSQFVRGVDELIQKNTRPRKKAFRFLRNLTGSRKAATS